MPQLTRLFIKTALVYFVLALLAGWITTIQALRTTVPLAGALSPVYFHLFMVGWVTQLIIGVAYWMFPRFTRERPRGYDSLFWATYGLLNAGLILRVFAEPSMAVSAWEGWGTWLAVSALLQWLGGMSFVASIWPRVKEK